MTLFYCLFLDDSLDFNGAPIFPDGNSLSDGVFGKVAEKNYLSYHSGHVTLPDLGEWILIKILKRKQAVG